MGASQRKDYTGNYVIAVNLNNVTLDADLILNGLAYNANATVEAEGDFVNNDASSLANAINTDTRTGTVNTELTAVNPAGTDYVLVTSSKQIEASATDVGYEINSPKSILLGLTSNVKPSNEVMKRINSLNSPYSVQATGVDKSKKIVIADSNAVLNGLSIRTRVLWGNRQGYIKAKVNDTSITFTYLDRQKNEIDTVKTYQEVIESGTMIILDELF